MKICYLANGAGGHIQHWLKYLLEKGHEVHVISFEQPDIELKGLNVHVVKTKKKYLYISTPYKYFQFRKIINNIKPDIVHALYVTKYGTIGALTGFHPFIISVLGSDVLIDPKESLILKNVINFALHRADFITSDGENSKDAIKNFGINSQKITVIFHGVDIEKYNYRMKDEKLREELGIFDSPTIISTRNLYTLYDIETLIRAAPFVLKKIPDAKFIIAGHGEQKMFLLNLTMELNLMDNIRFIGMIAHDELPRYLASADIYVSTSLSDGGLALSTAEAMACRLPVIITDFGDNKKWVENGRNGFIVSPKDPKSLAEKIIYLLENSDIRNEFGLKNSIIIEERNNYYKEMEKMEKLYEKLIERYTL